MSESLATYARRYCANWNPTNGCFIHEIIDWTVKLPKAKAGPCKVAQGESCEYFARAVLADPACPARIVEAYRRKIDSGAVKARVMRICPDCGADLLHRQRVCDRCRRQRRLTTYRSRRRRKAAPQLT